MSLHVSAHTETMDAASPARRRAAALLNLLVAAAATAMLVAGNLLPVAAFFDTQTPDFLPERVALTIYNEPLRAYAAWLLLHTPWLVLLLTCAALGVRTPGELLTGSRVTRNSGERAPRIVAVSRALLMALNPLGFWLPALVSVWTRGTDSVADRLAGTRLSHSR